MKWNKSYTRYIEDRSITLPDALLLKHELGRVTSHAHVHTVCRSPRLDTSEWQQCPLPIPFKLTPTKNGVPHLPFVKHVRLFP